jgi:uncharacterized protein (DUF608 family)
MNSGGQPPEPQLDTSSIRTFSESALREIAFPLGGIGAGNVSLGGRGNLRDWEIFNAPGKRRILPSFFAVWGKRKGSPPVTRVLEVERLPPFDVGANELGFGFEGLPRLKGARFQGEYPFAWLHFEDAELPFAISLEAFTPFVPHNSRDSSIPTAIFNWTVKNTGVQPTEGTIAFSAVNPVGIMVERPDVMTQWIPWEKMGRGLNRYRDEKNLRGLFFTGRKYSPKSPRYGSMAITTPHKDIVYTELWERGEWIDGQQIFWDQFSATGQFPNIPSSPSLDGKPDTSTLGLRFSLPAGSSITLPFVLSWHFPNRINYWDEEPKVKGKVLRNYYATIWRNAWDVSSYVIRNLATLERDTRLFHDALFSSDLPGYVLDAASSQASIMATNTCFRTEDGSLFAFEGCGDGGGCCPLNCTHVWNYAQAVAHLFPDLERSMRRTDFKVNTDRRGDMVFRTKLPILQTRWKHSPAADGQMGTIIRLYRDWKFSGDDAFLRELWPYAKRALEFAWRYWDKDRDGVMEASQHNTYDIEFQGWSSMTSSLYLGALKAGAEMAQFLGDEASGRSYLEIADKGRAKIEDQLFNGEYYEQKLLSIGSTRYQYGSGCLSDQLLGEWLGRVTGLGPLLDEAHVRLALSAIVRHNFRESMRSQANMFRAFALNNESGLLLCSWPRGGRPEVPFPYADEVWTGVEYQVASHLIYSGLIDEGLRIVRAVRERHDGRRRNPWNEVECGSHYARAMASWAVLLALSGFRWDGIRQHVELNPRTKQNPFRCFYSTGGGWGQFRVETKQSVTAVALHQLYGGQAVRSLALAWTKPNPKEVEVSQGGAPLAAEWDVSDGWLQIRFADALTLGAGSHFLVTAA